MTDPEDITPEEEAARSRRHRREIAVLVMLLGLTLFVITTLGLGWATLAESTARYAQVDARTVEFSRRVWTPGTTELWFVAVGHDGSIADTPIPLEVTVRHDGGVVHAAAVDLTVAVRETPDDPFGAIRLTRFEGPWPAWLDVEVRGLDRLPEAWRAQAFLQLRSAAYHANVHTGAIMAFLLFGVSGLAVSIPGALVLWQRWRGQDPPFEGA